VGRGQTGEQRIHDAFEHLIAVRVDNGVIGHQVADVAYKQQAATGQRQLAALGRLVRAVLVEHAGEGFGRPS